jgi:hypothetical protein
MQTPEGKSGNKHLILISPILHIVNLVWPPSPAPPTNDRGLWRGVVRCVLSREVTDTSARRDLHAPTGVMLQSMRIICCPMRDAAYSCKVHGGLWWATTCQLLSHHSELRG